MTVKQEAISLLKILKQRAIKNPKKYGENYGSKEILGFEDKWNKVASYKELAEALDILEEIYSWSPHE